MEYKKSQKYDEKFIRENIMGPNPMKLAEELLAIQPIPQNSMVLDLGCGRGVTSIFMVKEYGLRVFAADLWISPTENKKRFDEMKLTDQQIIPIKVEAHELPFAEEFFDAVVSIDAYHYFGLDKKYLGEHLLPFVRHGGYLLMAVPGFKIDIHDDLPPEMLVSWSAEDLETIHDMEYWTNILKATDGLEILSVREMEGCDECWNDWLACDNEYAIGDRKAMSAGAGKHMNFVAMILRRK
jgi:SAM-dependent methyltransferase